MTNEEAKRRMEICRDFLANNYSDMGEPNFMAFNMAIKALEVTDPSRFTMAEIEDCTSEEEVTDIILSIARNLEHICEVIKNDERGSNQDTQKSKTSRYS